VAAEDGASAWRNEVSGTAGGPIVQARSIHGDVRITVGPGLRPPGVPGLLPAVPAQFCGRAEELAALGRLAVESDPARRLAVVVIVGSGGLGKTSLAAHWLHTVSGGYPGGVLSADLGGDRPDPARPGDVLDGFLRVLGVAPEAIPITVNDQAALFRSVTAGRKMIVLLDNAASAAQVRPLLPGPGPEMGRPSLALVTTRWRIAGLALDGARFVELGPLAAPAATELFARMVGADRVAAERDASREVVRLCGGIPLAVCVSGARLAVHPQWPVRRIAVELAAERARLSALSLPGDLSVQAAFDASYLALPPVAALAYRTVALIPGPDFCADLAAAALNDQEHVQPALDTLVDASLLTETPGGRYHLHDLVRLHARGQLGPGPPGGERGVIARSVDWYLREAVEADKVVLPGRWRLGPLYQQPGHARPEAASPAEAARWLEARLPGLLAVTRAAHDAGLHPQAWQLCEALWGVLLFGKHYLDWLASHRVGLRSAQACGDRRAEAQMHIQLGAAHRSLGELATADRHFSRALELFHEAGHRLGEASALDQLGVVRLRRACYDRAISDFRQALAIHQDIGRPRGIALMNLNIGQALAASGREDGAIGYLRAADRQFAAIGESYHRARALTALGGALIGSGLAEDAGEPLRQALALTRELGAAYDQAHVHVRLADLAEALGQPDRAARHLEQALTLFNEMSAPQADGVRARLGESGSRTTTGSAGLSRPG
jgi:tetratricopeptide (TPR) repeat protein